MQPPPMCTTLRLTRYPYLLDAEAKQPTLPSSFAAGHLTVDRPHPLRVASIATSPSFPPTLRTPPTHEPVPSTSSTAYHHRFPTTNLPHHREPATVSPSATYAPNRDPTYRASSLAPPPPTTRRRSAGFGWRATHRWGMWGFPCFAPGRKVQVGQTTFTQLG
jgi:hypothetical protein